MKKIELKKLLAGYDEIKIENYLEYCEKVETEKDSKTGTLKNSWFGKIADEKLSYFFKKVNLDNFEIDGKHIRIASQYGNISVDYDYHAYKNKMYQVYPESVIDVSVVKENDVFSFSKDSGKITYKHIVGNPFGNDKIIGGYCIVKNKRGEFYTLLSAEDIEKHRKHAKADNVWKEWFEEMCLKTLIKKVCSKHFQDIYQNIETLDNENYDLEKRSGITLATKQDIENLKTAKECEDYYSEHKDECQDFITDFVKELATRKQQIKEGF